MRLNLRTGPGTDFRILGSIKTGDAVDILDRGDGWTKVRADGIEEGWIPAGFLQLEPPATVELERREQETSSLRTRLDKLEREAQELRSSNEELLGEDEAQKLELAELTQENIELRAGARWPERLAGAGIFGAGMIVGAILQRRSGRRTGSRVRL